MIAVDSQNRLSRAAPSAGTLFIASKNAPTNVASIGRYQLSHSLGKGTFGRVWLAVDGELHRKVAIKIPNPECLSDAKSTEAYLVEAQTLAQLDHPHIVPVYDVGRTDDGKVFVVSKFIPGGTLADHIKHGRPNAEEVARLIEACSCT